MHPVIYNEFRRILSLLGVKGRILEIGAVPNESSLLAMDLLNGQIRIGVNIAVASRFKGFDIIQANGNDMSLFSDGSFDCVMSNATIEHDRFFWKTCAEMRRLLRPGGICVVGAPAFATEADTTVIGLPSPWPNNPQRSWEDASLTFRYHGFPQDYYRFSDQAFRDVIFEGYCDVVLTKLMIPPRIIGYGFKRYG